MSHFISRNQNLSNKITEKLGNTFFKDAENFVSAYNSGMVSKNNNEISEIANDLVEAYKDVQIKGNQIIFISKSEIFLSESLEALEPWTILVKIKREVEDAITLNVINENSSIAFTPDAVGYVTYVKHNESGEEVLEKIGIEKTFSRQDLIIPLFDKYSSSENSYDNTYFFKARDFVELDDSFISRIHEDILNS